MMSTEKLEDHVNADLLRLTADAIEKSPESYNQLTFGDHDGKPSCNTPCCVAAHMANILNYDRPKDGDMVDFVLVRLVTRGGMYRTMARRIFDTRWPLSWFDLARANYNYRLSAVEFIPTSTAAVKVLRHLADNPEYLVKVRV